MAKVSKNVRVSKGGQKGGGRDFVKIVKSIKNPKTGAYSFKEYIVHKDHVQDFLKQK